MESLLLIILIGLAGGVAVGLQAPMASMIKSPAPSTRFSECSLSASRSEMGLRLKSWFMERGSDYVGSGRAIKRHWVP